MKKTYISPAATVVNMQHHTALLASSTTFTVNKDEDTVDPEDTW